MTPGENCPRCGTEWGSGGIGTDAVIAKLSEDVVRLRAALQSIADYRPSRQGADAFVEIAHHCQTLARVALAEHKGGGDT